MGNIVLLDELTINKIAAGEVVERPASVVKELAENAIDAGATKISIEIKNGGISYIRITDNGKGIAKDDLEMAFERHATSKIRNAEDLNGVKSMGFRGEALASIAAIANVEMISKTGTAETGNRIVVEGGKILEQEEIGCQKGTTITVTNLFYNTPVRYKFLKKDFTESGYIEDAITHLALMYKNISFQFINQGKTVIQTSGDGNIRNSIYQIFGKDIAEGVLDVSYELDGIKVEGVVGKPEIARSNRINQMFFVNKRYIKDKTLSSAAEQAFKGLLPIGKFGFLILNIEMPPQQVDVNVHPAKLEVRFEDENKIFKAVFHSIKETLLKGNLIGENPFAGTLIKEEKPAKAFVAFQPEPVVATKQTEIPEQPTQETIPEGEGGNIIEQLYQMRNRMKEEINTGTTTVEEIKQKPLTPTEEQVQKAVELIGMKNEVKYERIANEEVNKPVQNKEIENTQEIQIQKDDTQTVAIQKDDTQSIETPKAINTTTQDTQIIDTTLLKNKVPQDTITNLSFDEMYSKLFGAPKPKTDVDSFKNVVSEQEESYTNKPYKIVGIAFSTYIIIEIGEELYIIDQHAAHERILYEKVKKNFYDDKEKESQLMLIPDVITLSHKEMDIAKDHMALFEKAGFVLEEFDENSMKLLGVPNICVDLDTKQLFLDILDEIDTVARTARQEIEEKSIATIACKAAVKANMKLTKEEVDSLMTELLKLPNPFTCPHGRPTAMKITKYEIERKFSRK